MEKQQSKLLTIPIKAGQTTCAYAKSKFCQFVGTRKFGTKYCCYLFPSKDKSWTELKEKDGWLQRCKSCLTAEENSKEVKE